MDMKLPIGKKVLGLRILGVVKDFNFTSLHSKIAPLRIFFDPSGIKQLLIRIRPNNMSNTISSLEETWNKIAPDFPFEYNFLDEQIDKLYSADQRAGSVINVFSFLALFIACLGMFGLASFTAEQRVKEVGIRKVLGAKVPGIVLLLSKEYTKYILLANLFAWPIAYFIIDRWLQNFAYRIDISLWVFVLSGGIALLVALATVSFQAIKAAMANPVESLKYE
jgi:putative ABC transport system permease protein